MQEIDASLPSTKDGESRARRAATQYRERYPWVDEDGLSVTLGLGQTLGSMMSAINRCFDGAGMMRRGSRTTVLRLLLFAPDHRMTQTEIGREMCVTSANVTYLVDGLEKEGLVERVNTPGDRRVTRVRLTPEGLEEASRVIPVIAEFAAVVCGGFNENEKQLFGDLLERLLSSCERSYRED